MRKLMCLMLVVSGLGFGCGSDSKKDTGKTTDPATGDGDKGGDGDISTPGGDGDTSNPGDGDKGGDGDHTAIPDAGSTGGKTVGNMYPQCTPAVPVTWDPFKDAKKFTSAQLKACEDKCMNNQSCYTEANCPGLDNFQQCLSANGLACEAPKTSKCRNQFVDVLCCLNVECLAADGKSIDPNCTKCNTLEMSYSTCINADTACSNDTTFAACLADGGETTDGGVTPPTDAGTKPPTPIGHMMTRALFQL